MAMVYVLLLIGCLFLATLILINGAILRWNARSYPKRPQPIGDLSCQYNARSPLLRCAIKPEGPCRCEHYQPRSLSCLDKPKEP